jgi:trigger factor
MAEATHTHTHEEKEVLPDRQGREIGPCKLKITIEVTAQRVKEEIDHKYKDLNESMALPGFRKGHAPRNVLERKFGKALLDDLKFELLSGSSRKSRRRRSSSRSANRAGAREDRLEEGKPFVYEMKIEVRPTFEIKNYEGIKVVKPAIVVEEKDIDAVLKGFQESKAELVPAEDGVARENDQLTADFTLMVGRAAVETARTTPSSSPPTSSSSARSCRSSTRRSSGRRSATASRCPSSSRQLRHKAHAGKKAVIKTTIKSVKQKKLPPVDTDFAKKHFDMDSVDELKADIKKRIEREKEAGGRAAMGEKIVEELVKANDFPMPEGLIASGTEEALRASTWTSP